MASIKKYFLDFLGLFTQPHDKVGAALAEAIAVIGGLPPIWGCVKSHFFC